MLLLIIITLLLNFLIGRLFGFLLGLVGLRICLFLNFSVIYLMYGYSIQHIFTDHIPRSVEFTIATWIKVRGVEIGWSFLFDNLSVIMLGMVLTISGLVHYYSLEYMAGDPQIIKFLSYLSLFTMFMLILISAGNFLVLFFGWEGVGLSSYLLISFWNTRVSAGKAALKALLMNRIGDFFLLFAICLVLKYFKTLDFLVLFSIFPYFTKVDILFFGLNVNCIDLIAFLLFIAVVGKSAQIGLHTWLPDAMEGPTPVSALIHAATMVTAGVFLLIRCSFLFSLSVSTLKIILIVGGLTTLVSGFIAITQNDLKKIIAYSTCSQLGYMVLTCAVLNFSVSFFHLINHAFFKALLFLSAGAIIHLMNGEQDIRKMGALLLLAPFYYCCFLVASLSLIGLFFFSGFYSKEIIINYLLIFGAYNSGYLLFGYWVSLVGVFLTAFYSFKLLYFVFYNNTSSFYNQITKISTGVPTIFSFVFSVLLVLSISSGFMLKNLFINSLFFVNSIYLPMGVKSVEFLPFYLKLVPFIFSLCSGVLVICGFKIWNNKFCYNYRSAYILLNRRYFIDSVYNRSAVTILYLGSVLFTVLDKGLLEVFGPLGLSKILNRAALIVDTQHNQRLIITFYPMLLGMIIIYLTIFLWL